MEYARTLMTAASPEKRLELLSLIASAPESDEIDRRWAAQEQTRVTNRMELADKKLAEAETEKKAAVEGAKRAQEEARNATNEVATQRRLREEAEAKAKSQNATIRAAAAREIQDLRDKEATARKAAQVAMEREAASVEREHRAQRDLARRETSVLAPSAPPPPGVPRSFIASAAERLLRGDKDAASQFVIWTETPQGSDFWIAQKERLQHGDALEPAAASAVRAWLQAYKKAEP
jgi:hypothetical protein